MKYEANEAAKRLLELQIKALVASEGIIMCLIEENSSLEKELVKERTKYDKVGVVCPYCGQTTLINASEAWDENDHYEYTCQHCEKDYLVKVQINLTYLAQKKEMQK